MALNDSPCLTQTLDWCGFIEVLTYLNPFSRLARSATPSPLRMYPFDFSRFHVEAGPRCGLGGFGTVQVR